MSFLQFDLLPKWQVILFTCQSHLLHGKCQFIIIFCQEVKKKEERYEKGDR